MSGSIGRASEGAVRRGLIAALAAGSLLIPTAGSALAQDQASDSVIPALVPKAELPLVPDTEVNTSYAPNVPPASGRTTPAIIEVEFEIVEAVNVLDPASGAQYETWGFRLAGDDEVVTTAPGPMIRARVGDVIRFTLTNPADSAMPHNVDFHAVTGPGGGAASNTVIPGASATIEVRLLYPGLFMYHCAFGDVPEHIVRGMFGGVLVDPETPLPAVEHELYMVQSEFYTMPGAAEGDPLVTDRPAVTMEHPTYVVFNGARGALMGENAPRIQVGERMRIYFVNAGLNLISSFHAIGSHWDKVYQEGTLFNPPLRGSQTTLVPAGGSTIVELIGQVPATLVLVDHALARAFDKGAIGQVIVEGEPNPEIFEAFAPAASPMPGAMH
jgi:nitrite reductase (NO-forming)